MIGARESSSGLKLLF